MSLVFVKNLFFPNTNRNNRQSNNNATILPIHHGVNSPTSPVETHELGNPRRHDKESPALSSPLPPTNTVSDADTVTALNPEESSDEDSKKKRIINPRIVSDAIIGLADGLTVPFALAAGLTAFESTRVVLFGGFAELIAGSISMGLGGWLAGRGEAEFYASTLTTTTTLVHNSPTSLPALITSVFDPYSIPSSSLSPLIESLKSNSTETINFLMCFQHQLPPPSETKRTPLISALTIAAGYFIGGFIPLLPYFFVHQKEVMKGLYWSIGVMAVCLFIFGFVRCILVGEGGRKGFWGRVRGGVEMIIVGGVAAAASFGIVKALGQIK